MIYSFILRWRRLCVVGIQSEFEHIFLLWRGPFFWSSATAGEHTRDSWQTCLSNPVGPSFEWLVNLSPSFERPPDLWLLFKITDLILSFKSHVFFVYSWLSEHTFFRFCWSYLRTEISVTLPIGKKLYSSPSSFIFSFLWNHYCYIIKEWFFLY